MASEKLGMVPHQQLVFSEAFSRDPHPSHRRPASGDPGAKTATRELTASFLDHHHYFPPPPPPPPQASQFRHLWHPGRRSPVGEASEDDDDDNDRDEDDEDEDDEEEEVRNNNLGNIVTVAKASDDNQKEGYTAKTNCQKMKNMSTFGFKEGILTQSRNKSNNGNNESAEVYYYSQYLNGPEGPSSSSGQKDVLMLENGCGFSGSKENSYRSECGESLRAIFTDPITGILMEDAMILPCGHSYGSSGIQQIVRMKACYTCSQSVSEESIIPNLSLRVAVQAFKREEELQVNHMSKKRREKYDQNKGTFGDSTPADHPKGKGVQFPFSVTDRVIIKGNKRTPQRFVGHEAIVTTQCLNGWYVVKTLDNAESVKLQYRSLSKVTETLQPPKPLPNKMTPPNWL